MPDDLADVVADLEKVKRRIPEAYRDAVEKRLSMMVKEMKLTMERKGAVYTHVGKSSIMWSRLGEDRYSIHAGGRQFGAGHIPFVEFGTGSKGTARNPVFQFKAPDNPPVKKIKPWVLANGGTSAEAYRVARIIDRYGTVAQPFFRPVVNRNRDAFSDDIEESIEDVMQRHMR